MTINPYTCERYIALSILKSGNSSSGPGLWAVRGKRTLASVLKVLYDKAIFTSERVDPGSCHSTWLFLQVLGEGVGYGLRSV